jgi:hypothetical protein
VRVDAQLLLLDGGLDDVFGVEDLVEFLELLWNSLLESGRRSNPEQRVTYSAVSGFGDKEVDNGGLNGAPDAEDDISAPGDLLHGHGPGELVEKHS